MALAPRLLALALAALALAPAVDALRPPASISQVPLGIPQEGPDVPTLTQPVAVVTAFEDEYWESTEGARTRLVQVPPSPSGAWDRVILSFREYPSQDPDHQDPWDRLCSAAVAGVEVLRCTTPRTDFTLRKDITEFARLLPPGQLVPVSANTGTYNQPEFYTGGQWVTLKLEFYANDPSGAAFPQATVVPAWYYRHVCANRVPTSASVGFPASAPQGATVEITLSGHGHDEFWMETAQQPVFHVLVDGTEVAQAWPAPYTYAFVGFYGGGYEQHPLMWWTAQRALDIAGVHGGVGEVPPYRATVLAEDLALLSGTRSVSLVGENGQCYWPSSVSFLLR